MIIDLLSFLRIQTAGLWVGVLAQEGGWEIGHTYEEWEWVG